MHSSILVAWFASLIVVSAVPAPQLSGYSLRPTQTSSHSPRPSIGNHSTNHTNNSTETSQQAAERAQAVKDAFQFAWDGYYKYAFPNDELLPVTDSYANTLWVLTRTETESQFDNI